MPVEETAAAMASLYDQGKIRAIGVSNFSIAQMDAFRRVAPLHVLQSPYNLFERGQNGAAVYTFADPDNCHCLYIGGQKEYAKLQELRQQRIDEHNQLARRSSFEGGISDLWGPWKPEGLVAK